MEAKTSKILAWIGGIAGLAALGTGAYFLLHDTATIPAPAPQPASPVKSVKELESVPIENLAYTQRIASRSGVRPRVGRYFSIDNTNPSRNTRYRALGTI